MKEEKYIKAEELVKRNKLKTDVIFRCLAGKDNTVIYTEIALTAIKMARMEEQEKAIEAHKTCCPFEYRDGRCNISHEECNGACAYMKQFKELLNK